MLPKSKKSEKKLKFTRPRFNFGAKQKSKLQNFVLEGHPTVEVHTHCTKMQPGVDKSSTASFLHIKLNRGEMHDISKVVVVFYQLLNIRHD